MTKIFLKIFGTVFLIIAVETLLAQDSYVDSAQFSERHKEYLDNHPEFATFLGEIYQKNKAQTEIYVKKAKGVYATMSKMALKKGMLHHAEIFQNLQQSKFVIYGYFTFPFIQSTRKDLFFCYFAPREAEAGRDAYFSFRGTLPRDLINDTDNLAGCYRQNAKRLVKRIEVEKNRHAKALDESSARLAISFRNIDILEESAKYLLSQKK